MEKFVSRDRLYCFPPLFSCVYGSKAEWQGVCGGYKGGVAGGGEENSLIYAIWIKLCILPP